MKNPMFKKFLPRGGFALVATILLLVLLAVIAIGTLSLSAVSLRSSGHGKAQAQADANARMALMIAIGQLQELAGDDRRVTATADLKMEPAVEGGDVHASRYWTGVWSNSADDPATDIYTKTPEAKFDGWLVSGPEDMLLNPDSTTVPLDDGVKLVGEGSVGDLANEHVIVPLVDINSDASTRVGRYGWWVGDEGVKTRGNLPSKEDPVLPATDLTLGSRGGGWETLPGFGGFPARGAPDESLLSRVFTCQTLSLVEPTLHIAAPKHFHAMTMESHGLLTNSLTGGLRTDLTPYLENGFPAAPPAGPASGENILPQSIFPNIKGPTWDRLRALRTMRPPAGGKLTVAVGNGGDEALVSPVIFDVRLLLGAQLASQSATVYRIFPTGKIAVVLANPYPYPLRWNQNLEFELVSENNLPWVSPTGLWLPNSVPLSSAVHGSPYYIGRPDQKSVFGNVTLTIPVDELPPGGTQLYTITAQHIRPYDTNRVTIPLARPQPSDLMDIRKSIMMPYPADWNISNTLHVREGTATYKIGAILRMPGSSSGILHKIDTFELDSASWSLGNRTVSASLAEKLTVPFPLMSYSFQISQPGMDYGNILPLPAQLGIRNSTLRTFMDFNVRAQHYPRPIASYLSPPYFFEQHNNLALLPMPDKDPDAGGIPPTGTAFTRNLAISPLRWGHSSVTGPSKTILFDVPDEIVSLAQFQHVDLTSDNNFPSVASQPAYAVGNCYAPPLLKRGLSSETRYDYTLTATSSYNAVPNTYYDMSYLLNAALWDSCFLSTLPGSGSKEPLNPRIAVIRPGELTNKLHDPRSAASRLWVKGGFNVNSTRKDAWKALLASNRKLKHPADAAIPAEGAMFPRGLSQTTAAQLPKPSGDGNDSFNGFRRLTDAQIDALAEEITRQVRLRGPFVSLSHFVNRALINLDYDENHLGRSGTLQSAIDNAGLNMVPRSNVSGFANITPANNLVQMKIRTDGTPEADWVGTRNTDKKVRNHPSDTGPPVWASRSTDANPGNTGSMLSNREMLASATYSPEQGFRSTGIPGWLTQADVLQVIGPVISARSDTFRIRAYGEALDPSGKPIARAWCEAIVQRSPDFADSADPSETAYSELNPVNARYGRRFVIVSFRWLHPHEI
jgi:hypothetical protein